MLALVGAWAIVLTRLSNDLTFDAVLVASAFLLTIVMVWWVKSTQNFAERNPGQALLDGAQLIEYKKFEAESKGMAAAGRSMLTDDPSRVIEIKPINDEPDA